MLTDKLRVSDSAVFTAGLPTGGGRRWIPSFWDTRLSGLCLLIGLLLVWEVVVRLRLVDSPSFPTMSAILVTWAELTVSGVLPQHVLDSLRRMTLGYSLAIGLAVTIGLLMGYFRRMYNLLEPITEVLRPIPSPAYIPILILFVGLGDEMKVAAIAFPCFFPILLNTYSGVRSIDPIQVQTGRTFGLPELRIVWRIAIQAALPSVLTGMRISLATALILVVISEMVAAGSGIGFFILNSQRMFRIEQMYAGVVTLGMIGYGLNQLFLFLERRLIAWHIGATKIEAR